MRCKFAISTSSGRKRNVAKIYAQKLGFYPFPKIPQITLTPKITLYALHRPL
ncbi:hypothetical protein Barb4_04279 [Bacteroidales bacterium Barb4]|nr:hypothetical protein Barb4_04279 [Bacteroidales bacterium Barb4]